MADRFSLPITQYIPPNLRPLFQSVGADDVSNLVPTTGLRRGMEAAGRIGTAGEKPEDRIEAGLETLIPVLTLGAGRFLKQPAKAALMEMFGLSPGPDAEAQLEALTRANSEAELLALQEQALQQPVVDIQDVSGVAPFQQLGEGEALAPFPDVFDPPIDDSFGMVPFIEPDPPVMEVVLRPEQFLPDENQVDPAFTTRIDPVTATDVDTGTRFVDMDILQPLLNRLRTDGLPDILAASEFEDDLLSAFSPVRSMADVNFGEATIDIADRVRVARRIAEDAGVSAEIINDYFNPDYGFVTSFIRGDNAPDGPVANVFDPDDPNPFDHTGFRFGLFEDSVLRDSLAPVLADFPKQKFGSVDQFVKTLENRGVKPAELEARGLATKDLRNRFPDGVSLDEVFDQLVEDPVAVNVLKGDRVAYGGYFTPGGSDYQETVLTLNQNFDDGARGLPGADEHFGSVRGVPVVHYRSAVFPVAKDGGLEGTSSFHLGEIQSDITQRSRSAVQARNVLDSLPKGMLETLNSVESVGDARGDVLLEFFGQLSPNVKKKYLAPELEFSAKELSKVFDSLDPSYKKRHAASILSDLQNESRYQVPEDVGLGKLFKTNRVTDMAIKSAFDQIALPSNEGLEFFTLGTGDMAYDMTMGDLSGQREYYDKIVPSRIKNILAKLEKDSGLEMPKLGNVSIAAQDRSVGDYGGGKILYDVPGFEITENFLRALRETGISAFRDGGMVLERKHMALKPTPVALRPMFEPDPYTTLDRGPVVPSYIGEQDRDPRSSTYAEVIADNLFGLENRYDSVGEQFARQFNADELGVLKQMGLGALSGTVDFLRDIPGGVQGYGEDIYSAVKDLATDSREDRLRSAAADQLLLGKNVDGTPMEFDRYSAVWQQLNPVRGNPADPLDLLTDKEFRQLDMSVREGQLSDVLTAGSVVPVGAGIKTAGQLGIAGVRKLDGVIDKKFRSQAEGKLRDLGYEDPEITNFLEGRGFFPRALATEGSTDVLSTNSVFGLSEADANRVLAAERLRNEGASAAEIFDETGLEFYPIRDAGGNLVQEFAVSRLSKFGPPDERGVGTLTPKLNFDMGRLEEIFANGKATNLDLSDIISTDDPATLKALEGYRLDFSVEPKEKFGGYHRKEDKTINVNLGKKPSLARIQSVLNHEVEHAVGRFLFDDVAKTGTRYIDASYFQPGSTGRSKIRDYSVAAGANPKSLYNYKRERIADLRAQIANYENKLSTATPPNEVDPFRDVQGGFRTQEYLDDAREELAALLSMTSDQAYRSNVGEISASSTQPEGPQQVVSLTGLETLNPYLRNNRNVPFSAIPDALLSKLLPENRVMAIENRLYGSQASGAGAQENPLLQKLSPEVAGRSQLFVPTSFEDARELRIPVQVRQNADLDDIPFRDGGMVRDTRFTGLGSMGYML